MSHPADGTLRRLLDDPAGVADTERAHLASCPQCLGELVRVRADAERTRELLTPEAALSEADVDRAWARLVATDVDDAVPAPASAPGTRRRSRLRSPVAAAAGAAVLLAGGSAAAATDWLQVFRTEQVQAVTVTEEDLLAMPDLEQYGDLEIGQEPRFRAVEDAASAERATGLDVPEVTALPRGVTGNPSYQVATGVEAVFTFDETEARATASALDEPLPAPPPGMDGSEFRLVAGPGLAGVWSSTSGLPGLVVARAVAPTGYSTGVDFETARDYLLTLPGLPDDVAEELRGFSGDGTTLPLPVPADEVETSTADVDGVQATVFSAREGSSMSGVVWVEDGVVTVVAGTVEPDEVVDVAEGLRG